MKGRTASVPVISKRRCIGRGPRTTLSRSEFAQERPPAASKHAQSGQIHEGHFTEIDYDGS